MGIQSSIAAGMKIGLEATRDSGNLSNIQVDAVNKAISDLESANFSNQNDSQSVNVEELDLNLNNSVQEFKTEKQTLSNEQYDQVISSYTTQYDETLEQLDIVLKARQEELDDLQKLAIDTDTVEAERTVTEENNDADAQVINMIVSDMDACPEERLKQLGITQDEFQNYDLEQLKELYKKKIPSVQELYGIAGKDVNEKLRENSEFVNYEEYKVAKEEAENDVAAIKEAIKRLKIQKEQLQYDLLPSLDDYQNFEVTTVEIKEENVFDCLDTDSGSPYIDYDKYCAKYGAIDELTFLSEMKEKYPQYEVRGLKHQEILENMLKVSDEDENLLKIYQYLYAKEGKEAAYQYVEDIEDHTNQLLGKKKAEEFLSTLDENDADLEAKIFNHLKTSGKGLMDGVESFGEGIKNIFTSSDVYSANEYEAMFIAEALQEKGYGLDFNYNVSKEIGRVTPSIALSTICSPLGASTASTISSVSLGLSSTGNSYHNALIEGYEPWRAALYGIASGTSSACLSKLGSLPGISMTDESASLLVKMVKEGGQSAAQRVLTNGFYNSIILGKTIDLTGLSEQAIQSFIVASLASGAINKINDIDVSIDGEIVHLSLSAIKRVIKASSGVASKSSSFLTELLSTSRSGGHVDYGRNR